MHTIKPLDEAALLEAARATKVMLTVEEHSIFGGLGGACAEILLQKGMCVPFKIVGIPDEDTVTGSQTDIFKHYGITPQGLAGSAKGLLRSKVG
jgi:transketolase